MKKNMNFVLKFILTLVIGMGAMNLGLVSADESLMMDESLLGIDDVNSLSTSNYTDIPGLVMDPALVSALLNCTDDLSDSYNNYIQSGWYNGVPQSAEELTIEKLADFRGSLYANTYQIENAWGIQYLTNMNYIHVGNSYLNTMPSLNGFEFPRLRYIRVLESNITDLDWLKGADLSNTGLIYLSYNKLTNIDGIKDCNFSTTLAQIRLDSNEITNIDALSYVDMSNFTILQINDNKISSIEPLSSLTMPKIQSLQMQNNGITDFRPLRTLFDNSGISGVKPSSTGVSNGLFIGEQNAIVDAKYVDNGNGTITFSNPITFMNDDKSINGNVYENLSDYSANIVNGAGMIEVSKSLVNETILFNIRPTDNIGDLTVFGDYQFKGTVSIRFSEEVESIENLDDFSDVIGLMMDPLLVNRILTYTNTVSDSFTSYSEGGWVSTPPKSAKELTVEKLADFRGALDTYGIKMSTAYGFQYFTNAFLISLAANYLTTIPSMSGFTYPRLNTMYFNNNSITNLNFLEGANVPVLKQIHTHFTSIYDYSALSTVKSSNNIENFSTITASNISSVVGVNYVDNGDNTVSFESPFVYADGSKWNGVDDVYSNLSEYNMTIDNTTGIITMPSDELDESIIMNITNTNNLGGETVKEDYRLFGTIEFIFDNIIPELGDDSHSSTYFVKKGSSKGQGYFSVPTRHYTEGQLVTIETEPASMYKLVKATNGNLADITIDHNSFSFYMPSTSSGFVTVSVEFGLADGYYNVYATDSNNGSYEITEPIALAGETVSIQLTPADGYYVGSASVLYGLNVKVDENNLLTFTMPTTDVFVYVTFTKDGALPPVPGGEDREYFMIHKTEAENGSYDISAEFAEQNSIVEISNMQPDEGYMVDKVLVNNTEIVINGTIATFKMPSEQVTVEVLFKLINETEYHIYGNTVYGLTAVPSLTKATPGTVITIDTTGTIEGQRKLTGFMVMSGGSVSVIELGNSYTMIASDAFIMPMFTDFIPTYNVTVGIGSSLGNTVNNGYLEVLTPNVAFNGEYLFKVYPDPGYELERIIEGYSSVDSILVLSNEDVSLVDDSYIETMSNDSTIYSSRLTQAAHLELNATFKMLTYSIEIENTINGTVTATKLVDLGYGELVSLNVNPNEGYVLDQLWYQTKNNDKVYIDDTNSFTMPNDNIVVYATFTTTAYNVTVSGSIVNGTVTTDKSMAKEDEVITISITPDANYTVESCMVTLKSDGSVVSMSTDNTFIMPNEDVNINVIFTREIFTVSVVTPDEGGTPSVNKTTAMVGEVIEIDTATEDGYYVEFIRYMYKGDLVDNYNFTTIFMPAGDIEIVVGYAKHLYSITTIASPVEGGIVNVVPNARLGESIAIMVTPSTGYEVTYIYATTSADDVVVSRNDTFIMPAADVIVQAVFSAINYTINVAPGLQNVTVDVTNESSTTISTQTIGELVMVDAQAADGYKVTGLYYVLDGVASVMTEITDGQFEMPASNVIVTATVDTVEYGIEVEVADDDSLVGFKGYDAFELVDAKAGTMLEVEMKIKGTEYSTLTGLMIQEVDDLGNNVGSAYESGLIFAMPNSNIVITPIVEQVKYNVSVDTNIVGGSISTTTTIASPNTNIEIAVTPLPGYQFDGHEIYAVGTNPTGNFIYSTDVSMIDADAIITAKFVELDYTITITEADGSVAGNEVTSTPVDVAYFGENVTLSFPNPSVGLLSSVVLNEVDTNGDVITSTNLSAPYSFKMPANHVEVIYNYDATGFEIEIANVSNGTVTTNPVGQSDADETVRITAVANDGYQIKSVTVVPQTNGSETVVDVTEFDLNNGQYTFTMPTEDVTVIVEFMEKAYRIKIDLESGAVVGGSVEVYDNAQYLGEPIEYANANQTIYIKWITESGFHLQSMSVTPDNLNVATMSSSIVSTSFVMTASDVTITPIWTAKDTYVSIDETVGGSITVPSAYNAPGTTVELTVKPDTGYTYVEDSLTVTPTTVVTYDDIKDKYVFTMPSTSVRVSGQFVAVDYSVTVDDLIEGGTVSVATGTANYKDKVVVTVTPETGKVLESLTYSYDDGTGTQDVTVNGTTITMPAADIVINATFVDVSFKIQLATITNGTLVVRNSEGEVITEAGYDEEITLEVTANSGYTLDKVLAAHNLVVGFDIIDTSTDPITYTMPASDILLYATFIEGAKIPVSLNAVQDQLNGTVTLSASGAFEGDSVYIYANPNAGYAVGDITFTNELDEDVTSEIAYATGKFTMPAYEVKVLVELVQQSYTITTSEDLTYTATDVADVKYGEEVSFTVTAPAGQSVNKVNVLNGSKYVSVSVTNGTYTFTMPEANVVIEVTYNSANVTGTVVFDITEGYAQITRPTAAAGSTVTLYTKANTGVKVESITIVGDSLEEYEFTNLDVTNASNTFIVPGEDYTITVLFSDNKLTLTGAANDNGTIEFLVDEEYVETASVVAGENVTVKVTANEGYQFNYFTVNEAISGEGNGASATAGKTGATTFTYRMLDEDVTLYASITEVATFRITQPVVQSNGLVNIEVNEATVNSEVMISVEPKLGYAIDTAAYIEVGTGARTAIEFDINNIAVISMPESDIELDVTFISINDLSNDEVSQDLETETPSTDLVQTETNTEVTDTQVELDVNDKTQEVITTTSVLTGDQTQSLITLSCMVLLAGISIIMTRKKY